MSERLEKPLTEEEQVFLRSLLVGFHLDSACGGCGGPLEDTRDVICERCTLQNELEDRRAYIKALEDRKVELDRALMGAKRRIDSAFLQTDRAVSDLEDKEVLHNSALMDLEDARSAVEQARQEIRNLREKYEGPAKCNRGHERFPLRLWDCPECVGEQTRAVAFYFRKLIEALPINWSSLEDAANIETTRLIDLVHRAADGTFNREAFRKEEAQGERKEGADGS
jgi:hypothetical protein